MTSQQYEELCRFAIADRLRIRVDRIQSVYVPNKTRKAPWYEFEGTYRHQIDLYWEVENDITRYLTIANAKWRSKDQVRQEDVLLLAMVRQKVGAHKAMMITNSDFTGMAGLAAREEGIGLLIVRPNFDSRVLHPTDRAAILKTIRKVARNSAPAYTYEVKLKGFGPVIATSPWVPQPAETSHATALLPACESTILPASGGSPPVDALLGSAGDGLPGPAAALASDRGGSSTRLGPGPGFRMK
jgi:hypothetical protein